MAVVIGCAATFVLVAIVGRRLGAEISIDAAPFVGVWLARVGIGTVPAIALAGLAVWKAHELAEDLSWSRLLLFSFLASAVWGASLALVDGSTGLSMGLSSPHDYLAAVPEIDAPGRFVRTFVDEIDRYPVHVRSHPPLFVVALWWLDRLGLGGVIAPTAVTIVAGASVVPAALIATRASGDPSLARRAAPYLVFAPAAIWTVTSADTLYAALAAWTVALFVLAGTRDNRAILLGLGGGCLFGVAVFSSYGSLLIAPIAAAVPVARRRWSVLVAGIAPVVVLVALFAAAGFWWLDGLNAARAEYAEGISALRPYSYFLIANLVVAAVAIGPAAAGGLTLLRDRRLWLLVGPALLAVLLADVSGLAKGEVERIWLPFYAWIGIAAAALPKDGRRLWLATHAVVAILLQSVLFTPW